MRCSGSLKLPAALTLVVLAVTVAAGDRSSVSGFAGTDTPPDTPVNISPGDGATGVGAQPQLCVDVSDPDADPLEVTFYGRDLTAAPGEDFAIVVIPDSEFYSNKYPQIFDSQTEWIVENKEARNIVFVSHAGDIVHTPLMPLEWFNADVAMSKLEDPVTTMLPEGIPYGIAVGNHDNAGAPGTLEDQYNGVATLFYNEHFGVSRFEGRGYYGDHFGVNNDNHYELFSASGMDFIIFHLEFDAWGDELRQAVLDWTDALLEENGDRRAILTSHYLLDPDGTFGNNTLNVGDQGQATYDALKDNPNLFLMLCAHLFNNPRRTDIFEGNTIHTLMQNYQGAVNGGNGWLRILTFSPQNDEIRVETYSTWIDEFRTDSVEQFTLAYDMEGGIQFQRLGSVQGVPSDSAACLPWPGRQDGSAYEWFVEVSDATSVTVGPRWTFESTGSCTSPAECDDGNPCNLVDCSSNVCNITPVANCCVDAGDCDDGNQCTDDACNDGACESVDNTAACTDGDACTQNDTCSAGVCSGTALDCSDGNDCTADACNDGVCQSLYAPVAGCCTTDSQCDDANYCTTDSCDAGGGSCSNDAEPGCCSSDLECSDSSVCTADVCLTNRAAVFLDGLGAHVSMGKFGFGGALNDGLNTPEFTIELWFKWDGGGETTPTSDISNDSGGIVAYPLITKGRDKTDTDPASDINYFLGILEGGHVLAADFEEHASASNPGLNHPVLGITPVSVGVWHHAAATYNGCCWQLYLDGQPETEGSNCPGEPPNFDGRTHFAVGAAQRDQGATRGAFSGFVDEARVWKRALSQAEIQANMNQAIGYHPELLGRWGFDEASGYVAVDSTGNDEDGKFVLAEWTTADLPPAPGNASCQSTPIVGCCVIAAQCDDGNACTTDSCVALQCRNEFTPSASCCLTDDQCDDGDPCTNQLCDGTGSCSNPPLDTDGDQSPDCADSDDDNDGFNDACDNCAAIVNADQADLDGDFEGDLCDLNDGVILLSFETADLVSWQPEAGFDSWNVYTGDVDVLRSEGTYTQLPGANPIADQVCGQSEPQLTGIADPGPDRVAFILTTGVAGGIEGDLGVDSSGGDRPNDNPCP